MIKRLKRLYYKLKMNDEIANIEEAFWFSFVINDPVLTKSFDDRMEQEINQVKLKYQALIDANK